MIKKMMKDIFNLSSLLKIPEMLKNRFINTALNFDAHNGKTMMATEIKQHSHNANTYYHLGTT